MERAKWRNPPRDFKRVRLADLRQGRRGKHHDAVMPIVDEIATLPESEAIVIPLEKLDIPLPNLRSALTKAALSRSLRIATYSDQSALYIWRKTTGSRSYERAPKNGVRAK